jgi:hypothetical protein
MASRRAGGFSVVLLGALLLANACGSTGKEPSPEDESETSAGSRPASTDERLTREIYVSTDIESDGPIPGPHSMLSLGSAAFSEECDQIATFSANLELLEGSRGHPDNMAWWAENQAAWEVARQDPQRPSVAMAAYADWLDELPGKPVFVGYPAAWDFMFVQWYLKRFVGRSPFGHSALDIRSYAMAVLDWPYWGISKSTMPERWIPEAAHTHIALDDAIEQGQLFCNILRENRSRHRLISPG